VSIVLPRCTLQTLLTCGTGTASVTFTNTAPNGGAQMNITGVNVPTSGSNTWGFSATADNCTGTSLAPGGTCTVTVRFTSSLTSGRGTNRAGTITFTDNGAASPQSAALSGFATP
jgi:hypothetical protein